MNKYIGIYIVVLLGLGCQKKQNQRILPTLDESRYNVAFLIMDGVYNTELTAPYDIFQHTQYREGIKAMNVFTVANTLAPITTFEGLRILPDFDYLTDELPTIDILVVPSAEHHLDTDLQDDLMINWVRETGLGAQYVTSHCDGAFVLAQAGLLDDVVSTTFPSDVDTYRKMFPHLEVVEDVLFVHDDQAITSAGGAKSFEAALYLCELLYGPDIAKSIAKGLVIDWDIKDVTFYNPNAPSSIDPADELTSEAKSSSFKKAILTM